MSTSERRLHNLLASGQYSVTFLDADDVPRPYACWMTFTQDKDVTTCNLYQHTGSIHHLSKFETSEPEILQFALAENETFVNKLRDCNLTPAIWPIGEDDLRESLRSDLGIPFSILPVTMEKMGFTHL